MYYIYMLRCSDNSIYTGITKDLERRINEHLTKDEKCAKYTKNHDAQKLECAWSTETKALASKLEFHIKRLSKSQKEDLIKNNNLQTHLASKIESEKYTKIF